MSKKIERLGSTLGKAAERAQDAAQATKAAAQAQAFVARRWFAYWLKSLAWRLFGIGGGLLLAAIALHGVALAHWGDASARWFFDILGGAGLLLLMVGCGAGQAASHKKADTHDPETRRLAAALRERAALAAELKKTTRGARLAASRGAAKRL
jgi:hypothetical protein